MNLRKDHYRKTFSSSKKWKEPHRTIGFKSQNGEGSTLSNLGSADDFVRATFDSDGLRVGEPNAKKKILLGVEEATHFLGYLKRAGQPIAPRIVLFLFSLSICVAYFFSHSKYTQTQIFGLAGHSIVRSGLVRRFCCQRRDSATNL